MGGATAALTARITAAAVARSTSSIWTRSSSVSASTSCRRRRCGRAVRGGGRGAGRGRLEGGRRALQVRTCCSARRSTVARDRPATRPRRRCAAIRVFPAKPNQSEQVKGGSRALGAATPVHCWRLEGGCSPKTRPTTRPRVVVACGSLRSIGKKGGCCTSRCIRTCTGWAWTHKSTGDRDYERRRRVTRGSPRKDVRIQCLFCLWKAPATAAAAAAAAAAVEAEGGAARG